jgi:TatD DNase family protein
VTAWTDSHCHLGYEGVDEGAVEEALDSGVTRLITIGTDAQTSALALAAARRHPNVYATVGLHPHEASLGTRQVAPLLDDREPKIVGVGECGLDFYYEHSPRAAQREAFAEQIQMAHQKDLTLVVHTREAWDETFDILAGEGPPDRWVVHCFSGGPEEARRALSMGAYLSFSGIVTFKKAAEVRQAAALCPMDRMLVETDSPYLAPVPNRGRPNRPAWVPLVGAAVAELRKVSVEEVAAATWDNTTAAFRLPA